MKKLFYAVVVMFLAFTACTKSDDEIANLPAASGVSTSVFYTDTFRIYSTDLKGGNRKLVVDEDLRSQNNYISQVSVLPSSQQLVYAYSIGFTSPQVIKTCKFDGSDKKVIKTLASNTSSIGFVKGTADGLIFYQTNTFLGSVISTKTFSIKADGTDEKELQSFLYPAYISEAQISNLGKGILGNDGYFFKITNGLFAESESFNIFLNEDKTKIEAQIISADATKAAMLQSTTTLGKYEIRIKDNLKAAPTSKVLYTLNIPSTANQYSPQIYFVNGTKNILVTYGKFTSPKGSASDFTNCDLVDTATGLVSQTWKFTGDDIGIVLVD
jgi:hypothetical protein